MNVKVIKMDKLRKLYDVLIREKGFTSTSIFDIPKGLKYVVSIEKPNIIGVRRDIELKDLDFNRFVKIMNKYWYKVDKDEFIGCWIDEGIVYFDISINVESRSLALTIARDNNQKAIYDVVNDKSIYLLQDKIDTACKIDYNGFKR